MQAKEHGRIKAMRAIEQIRFAFSAIYKGTRRAPQPTLALGLAAALESWRAGRDRQIEAADERRGSVAIARRPGQPRPPS